MAAISSNFNYTNQIALDSNFIVRLERLEKMMELFKEELDYNQIQRKVIFEKCKYPKIVLKNSDTFSGLMEIEFNIPELVNKIIFNDFFITTSNDVFYDKILLFKKNSKVTFYPKIREYNPFQKDTFYRAVVDFRIFDKYKKFNNNLLSENIELILKY